MSMPYRIQRIEDFVKELESGDLKLRVRVLEVIAFRTDLARSRYFSAIEHIKIVYISRREQLEKQPYSRWQPCIQS